MINRLREELSELSAKIRRLKIIEAMLLSLSDEKWALSISERDLKYALIKEETDIERLEETTAVSILYSVIGRRKRRLSKKQQDAYAAKLEYDEAVRRLDDSIARMDELVRERDTLYRCSEEYDRVFSELKKLLREDPAYAERFGELERRRDEINSRVKELDEAVWAGNAAMDMIMSIESSLSSAERCGTWDLCYSGGLFIYLAKHSHLDDAQAVAELLQMLLSRFRSKISDIRIRADIGVPGVLKIDGFLRLADFFDGFIADWLVLDRIYDSRGEISLLKYQVGDALSTVSALKSDHIAEKAALEKQIEELILRA